MAACRAARPPEADPFGALGDGDRREEVHEHLTTVGGDAAGHFEPFAENVEEP